MMTLIGLVYVGMMIVLGCSVIATAIKQRR